MLSFSIGKILCIGVYAVLWDVYDGGMDILCAVCVLWFDMELSYTTP